MSTGGECDVLTEKKPHEASVLLNNVVTSHLNNNNDFSSSSSSSQMKPSVLTTPSEEAGNNIKSECPQHHIYLEPDIHISAVPAKQQQHYHNQNSNSNFFGNSFRNISSSSSAQHANERKRASNSNATSFISQEVQQKEVSCAPHHSMLLQQGRKNSQGYQRSNTPYNETVCGALNHSSNETREAHARKGEEEGSDGFDLGSGRQNQNGFGSRQVSTTTTSTTAPEIPFEWSAKFCTFCVCDCEVECSCCSSNPNPDPDHGFHSRHPAFVQPRRNNYIAIHNNNLINNCGRSNFSCCDEGHLFARNEQLDYQRNYSEEINFSQNGEGVLPPGDEHQYQLNCSLDSVPYCQVYNHAHQDSKIHRDYNGLLNRSAEIYRAPYDSEFHSIGVPLTPSSSFCDNNCGDNSIHCGNSCCAASAMVLDSPHNYLWRGVSGVPGLGVSIPQRPHSALAERSEDAGWSSQSLISLSQLKIDLPRIHTPGSQSSQGSSSGRNSEKSGQNASAKDKNSSVLSSVKALPRVQSPITVATTTTSAATANQPSASKRNVSHQFSSSAVNYLMSDETSKRYFHQSNSNSNNQKSVRKHSKLLPAKSTPIGINNIASNPSSSSTSAASTKKKEDSSSSSSKSDNKSAVSRLTSRPSFRERFLGQRFSSSSPVAANKSDEGPRSLPSEILPEKLKVSPRHPSPRHSSANSNASSNSSASSISSSSKNYQKLKRQLFRSRTIASRGPLPPPPLPPKDFLEDFGDDNLSSSSDNKFVNRRRVLASLQGEQQRPRSVSFANSFNDIHNCNSNANEFDHYKSPRDRDGDYSYAYDCSVSPAFLIKCGDEEGDSDDNKAENIYEEIADVKEAIENSFDTSDDLSADNRSNRKVVTTDSDMSSSSDHNRGSGSNSSFSGKMQPSKHRHFSQGTLDITVTKHRHKPHPARNQNKSRSKRSSYIDDPDAFDEFEHAQNQQKRTLEQLRLDEDDFGDDFDVDDDESGGGFSSRSNSQRRSRRSDQRSRRSDEYGQFDSGFTSGHYLQQLESQKRKSDSVSSIKDPMNINNNHHHLESNNMNRENSNAINNNSKSHSNIDNITTAQNKRLLKTSSETTFKSQILHSARKYSEVINRKYFAKVPSIVNLQKGRATAQSANDANSTNGAGQQQK